MSEELKEVLQWILLIGLMIETFFLKWRLDKKDKDIALTIKGK
jgi:hypothetical protein